jgi:hypothetical protein
MMVYFDDATDWIELDFVVLLANILALQRNKCTLGFVPETNYTHFTSYILSSRTCWRFGSLAAELGDRKLHKRDVSFLEVLKVPNQVNIVRELTVRRNEPDNSIWMGIRPNAHQGNFTYESLHKGETTRGKYIVYESLTPSSNLRWINHIEFGKKKIMLGSSVDLGK